MVEIDAVAVERAFYKGNLVEVGSPVRYEAKSSDAKLPRWLVKKGDELPEVEAPKSPDLRPAAAQKAAKQKAGALAGDTSLV